jgi:hypothetical protein
MGLATRSLGVGIAVGSCLALPLWADSSAATSAELLGSLAGAGPIAGALVRLTSQANGETRTSRSGPRGEFRFLAVRPGRYTLTAEAPGWATQVLKDVVLQIGTSAAVNLRLAALASGTVAVQAQPDLADPQRTQLAQIVTTEQIADLPIGLRNFTDFSLTTPGVVQQNAPQDFGAPASDLSVNGMNPRQNNFMLDGVDNNDLGNGAMRSLVSQEAVQEFQVLTGGFSAEYGRATGGILNSITRSGGNAFAGSAFCFISPGTLAANSPQGATARNYRLTQYGATASGAVVPDRLFYFVSMERMARNDSNTVTIDPTVQAALTGTGFPVQDGVIPYTETQFTALIKLDYLQSAQSHWEFRLNQGQDANGSQIPFGGLVAASNAASSFNRDLTAMAAHRWLSGDSWVNDLRFMHAVRDNALYPTDPGAGVEVLLLGTASAGTQRLAMQGTRAVYDQLADTVLISAERHTIKTGFDLLQTRNSGTVAQNFAGIYQFQAIPQIGVNSALEAYLAPNPFGGAGLPAAFVQSFGNPATSFRTLSSALFVQDDWALGDRLLIKLGLRYDREDLPRFSDTPGYDALANPSTQATAEGPVLLPNGPYPYGALLSPDLDWSSARLAPRLALSWQAQPALRFHAGWGIYYGSTNLGPLMGARVYNGVATQTVERTLLDPIMAGPWISWANADGLAANHRYGSLPPGQQSVVLPGAVAMPENRQGVAGVEWIPNPTQVLTLELVTGQGRHFLNVRNVNAFVPYAVGATAIVRPPDLDFSAVQRLDDSGESRYFGQTLQWRWRPDASFDLDCHYTHSRALDNYIDWNPDFTVQNSFDPSQEWGPSYQNQTHRAVASAAWRSGSERSPWLRNWTLAAIGHWESGRPYTILAGYDRTENGDGSSTRPAGVGRNSATSPSIGNLDLRLGRAFPLGPVNLEALLDVFNLCNSTQVQAVQNDLATTQPQYGTPVAFFPKRQVQFGLRTRF